MHESLPFRPLPACVFAPGPVASTPVAAPPDFGRLAGELLRSLHVGGARGHGQVRLVLGGVRGGEELQITVSESATGVVATLHADEGEDARRLLRAIERELERRGVPLAAVELA